MFVLKSSHLFAYTRSSYLNLNCVCATCSINCKHPRAPNIATLRFIHPLTSASLRSQHCIVVEPKGGLRERGYGAGMLLLSLREVAPSPLRSPPLAPPPPSAETPNQRVNRPFPLAIKWERRESVGQVSRFILWLAACGREKVDVRNRKRRDLW